METKQRGKFSSLDKQEARRLLETYVNRSLSNCSDRPEKYKGTMKRTRDVQKSANDSPKPGTFSIRKDKRKMVKDEIREAPKEENAKIPVNSDKTENSELIKNPDTETPTTAIKKEFWFKNFFSLFLKKKVEKNEEKPISCVNEHSETVPSEGPGNHIPKRNISRKNSIKKVFSFKKKRVDEGNVGSEGEECTGNTKMKRPTVLPLKHICRPASFRASKTNKDSYYYKVSEEIELIVKESDKQAEYKRRESLGNESTTGETEDQEALIKKIVSILRKQGDEWDKKVKEDPTISTFFRDISYNSFKQLVDVYVDKEIKNKVADITPEDFKFAYSIHFTAKVAGISSHPVNRIMGFGNKYLQDQDTFFSNNRKEWDDNVDQDEIISPD